MMMNGWSVVNPVPVFEVKVGGKYYQTAKFSDFMFSDFRGEGHFVSRFF